MNYFLDTNVEIGYVFCTDPWHDYSVKLFNDNDLLYYSHCVDKEFYKKYDSILKEQKNFFYQLKNELKESSRQKLSLNDLKIKAQIIFLRRDFEENKKDKISEVLWKLSQPKHEYDNKLNTHVCNVEDLLVYLEKFIRGFERKLNERINYFEFNVILHKRYEQYMDLNEKLLFEADVHFPDNCIILDAHDLSLNKGINLEFVTSDENMINKINTMVDLLFIDEFLYLKDFVNNN